ncbi:MAG: hypothetical protein ACHRXM_23105, partial [Isosphaerales bacterium]
MRRVIRKLMERTRRSLGMDLLTSELTRMREQLDPRLLTCASQLVLANQYRALAHQGGPFPGFQDVEFRAFSQNGEDGILLYIFSLIGMGGRRCVEICAGDGIECNTANLIVNHGWTGLMFDGNAQLIERGRAFYSRHGDTRSLPPRLVNAW